VRYHVVQLPGDCQALLARSPAGRFLTASRHRLGPLPAEPQPLGHPEQPQQSGRAAKVIAAALVGLVFGAAGSAVPTGIGLAFVAGHGDAIALAGATIARHAGGAVLGAGLLAAVGVGLGTLVRAQLGAVIGVFAWAFFLEAIVGGLFNSVGPYLPFTATTTLAGSRLGGGGFGFSGSSSATPPALRRRSLTRRRRRPRSLRGRRTDRPATRHLLTATTPQFLLACFAVAGLPEARTQRAISSLIGA
jgi:hypothetical protein